MRSMESITIKRVVLIVPFTCTCDFTYLSNLFGHEIHISHGLFIEAAVRVLDEST